jgi:hypothetical protein
VPSEGCQWKTGFPVGVVVDWVGVRCRWPGIRIRTKEVGESCGCAPVTQDGNRIHGESDSDLSYADTKEIELSGTMYK